MESGAAEAPIEPAAGSAVRELLRRAIDLQSSDPEAARQHALEARVVARAGADGAGEAEALYRLASLAHFGGEPERAFGLALEASEVAQGCGARLIEAWSGHLLGIVHYQASNFTEALEHCLAALDAYQATGAGVDDGNMLNTIAAIYHSMGDNDRAISTYEEALAAAEPYGRHELIALILGNIARIRSLRSEYLTAVSVGRRAVAIARQHSFPIVTNLLSDLAEAYIGLADPDRAERCFIEARKAFAEFGDAGDAPSIAAQLGVSVAEGRVALRRGAIDDAIAILEEALETAGRGEVHDYDLEINDLLATAFKRSGRFEDALDRREQHDARYRTMFSQAADLRLRTLQVAHDTTTARQEVEIYRLHDRGADRARFADQPTGAHQLEVFEQLAVLTEFRDSATGEHTNRVGDMAAEIAHALGQSPAWCEQLRLAARLHDIGKVAVPDAVLRKTGPLTVEEYDLLKAHTSMGHRILAGNSATMFQTAAEIAQSHHEWWDGTGYPLGIGGDAIPLSGRIVAIADVYDALCSPRPYKRAWPRAEAARFVISGRGGQFDPTVVEAFITFIMARDPQLGDELFRS